MTRVAQLRQNCRFCGSAALFGAILTGFSWKTVRCCVHKSVLSHFSPSKSFRWYSKGIRETKHLSNRQKGRGALSRQRDTSAGKQTKNRQNAPALLSVYFPRRRDISTERPSHYLVMRWIQRKVGCSDMKGGVLLGHSPRAR